MSSCPGYLGIVIHDLLDEEELFNYDNLIFCYPARLAMPTFFNVTFSFPNKGQRWDRTFDVKLYDSKKTHHVYLTHLLFETMFLQSQKHVEKEVHRSNPAPWPVLAISLTATLLLMLFLHVAYVYLEVTKVKAAHNLKKKNFVYYGTVGSAAVNPERCHQTCDGVVMHSKSTKMTQRQSMFIVCFIAFRVVYSLVFTFTVFLALMGLVLQGDLKTLSKLPTFQKEKYNTSSTLFTQIEKYEQQELLRQARLVGNMQGACTNYLGEIFDAMIHQINNITLMNQVQMYSQENSVTTLLEQLFYNKLMAYREEINLFTKYYQNNVTKSLQSPLKVFKKYLAKVYKNRWLQFPQILFNKSNFHFDRPSAFHDLALSGDVVDFSVFLPLEEVEDVQLWSLNLWEKYRLSLPNFPHLPPVEFNGKNLQCSGEEFVLGVLNASERLLPQRSNPSRYMAPHLPHWANKGQAWKPQKNNDKFKYLGPPDPVSVKSDVFDFQLLEDHLSLQFLWIAFLIMDVFLIAYRFSHTFITARTLYQGFENTIEISRNSLYDKPDVKSNRRCEPTMHESETHCLEYVIKAEGHTHVIPPIPPPVGNHISSSNKLEPSAMSENHRHKYKPPKKVHFKKEKQVMVVCNKDIVLSVLNSNFLPRMVVGMVLCILIVWGSSIAAAVFSTDTITNLDGFRTFLVSLDVLVNRTNWYLSEQTDYYNNITMDIYHNQMTSELLNFQTLLQYFNSGEEIVSLLINMLLSNFQYYPMCG